ncbi:sugar kinase [Blastococcus atacamensis]|uniref:sugar kinase n=1 Tax=Blastococcus atacamensis TaxID=2070508 RepID=UPI0018E48FD9|nr:sugar kinase [Blastococcus atacamensis]
MQKPTVLMSKPAAPLDVLSVGETMLMFVPDPPRPLSRDARYRPTVAGAESNVAAFAAALGARSAWVGRVGDDDFGRYVVDELTGRGIEVCYETDEARPTGVAFKEPSPTGSRVRYYRRGSAASAMGTSTEATVRTFHSRIVHLSGITPALSTECEELVCHLVEDRPPGAVVSFDVNWRPVLWPDRDPGVLLRIACAADVVFVGLDEAEALWGARNVREVRQLLPGPDVLVVKQGPAGATAFRDGDEVFVPSLDVDVVEPVGAGDALAAGFLVGLLRGMPVKQSLRLGTIVAASALQVSSDVGPLPSEAEIAALLHASDAAWEDARLGLHDGTTLED